MTLWDQFAETTDTFLKIILERAEEGDYLAFLDVGAYGAVLSSEYNTRPRSRNYGL